MAIKQYAFNCEESFINKLDNFIKNKIKYKDRTQFILMAIEEKMDRKNAKN